MARKCRWCNSILPLTRYFWCLKCKSQLDDETPYDSMPTLYETRQDDREVSRVGVKKCSKCHQFKAKTEFFKQTQLYGCGLKSSCKECAKMKGRVRRHELAG